MNICRDIKLGVVTLLLFSMSGCASMMPDKMTYPPAYPVDNPPPPKKNGTIYQEGYSGGLYSDHIASHVGDVLTVRLEESTQGQKLAQTQANKTSTTQFVGPNIGVRNVWPQFNTNANSQFNGSGLTKEQNQLQGRVSVTVTHVLANGNLVVQGESWLTIDMGRENVSLAGIVRPEDIDADNTVSSQRIAGARIVYTDNGMDGDSSRGGFLTQFIYKYFPY